MARNHRSSGLESRSARLKLVPRGKPHAGPSLARGIRQDYRRTKTGNGKWIAKGANGHARYWTRVVAEADDFDESNGRTILNFYEVQNSIKKLARGKEDGADSAPLTINSALTAYKGDLIARGAAAYNVQWPRLHGARVTPMIGGELLAEPGRADSRRRRAQGRRLRDHHASLILGVRCSIGVTTIDRAGRWHCDAAFPADER